MRNLKDLTNSNLTRRTFLQGIVATGAAATLAGCSTDDSDALDLSGNTSATTPTPEVEPVFERFYGASSHNCGGRCVSVAEVSNGKIHRILTDESKFTSDGTYLDKNELNWPQTRNCTKCRSYRYRLYHSGRLLYPLKQTKKRGDLSGFERISWEQALREIATKHKNVLDTYGSDAIYTVYAFGSYASEFQGGKVGPIGNGSAFRYMGGSNTDTYSSYSIHQWSYMGHGYTGMNADWEVTSNSVAKYTNGLVFWGSNTLTTQNHTVNSTLKAIEEMKLRNPNAKVTYIGPYCSDNGALASDEWVVSKSFTDPALIAGMIYHMLDNTFDLTTGAPKANPWLDVDYLDTLVYGFFDSPAYSITTASGAIGAVGAGDRDVPEVPAGRSYCSWLLGNNDNAQEYSATTTNYTAQQFGTTKRWASCSYDNAGGANTAYNTKADFNTPKTPEWASTITGVPVDTIKELAEYFAKTTPITTFWGGGMQRGPEGVASLYAIQALHIITKNVATLGAGYTLAAFFGFESNVADPKALNVNTASIHTFDATDIKHQKPLTSCVAWNMVIKRTYEDELAANGYNAEFIPNYEAGTKNGQTPYWDDAGTKTFVMWDRDADGTIKVYNDDDGNEFYDWIGRSPTVDNVHAGTPTYAGIRLMYNTGGNIPVNQHMNTNDTTQMFESLNLNNHEDAESFCLVSFDNFMSASPRWSDYVLPATTSWEQQDVFRPNVGSPFYLPAVSTPPGESKPMWDFANELVKMAEEIGLADAGSATKLTGNVANKTVQSYVKELFDTAKVDPSSPYYNMSWDEFIQNQFLPAKADDTKIVPPSHMAVMNAYKALSNTDKANNPFITGSNNVPTNEVTSPGAGYGNEFNSIVGAPASALRFQVYSRVFTWQYENRFNKYHGFLSPAERGQTNKDLENDRVLLEIPLYYAYEDYFMEAYGGNDKLAGLDYVVVSTHSRYNANSSMSENPMLRELTHRVPGVDAKGKLKIANDYNDYATTAPNAFAINAGGIYPNVNNTIGTDGSVNSGDKEVSSYPEITINRTDGNNNGIKDGDLIQLENPIGAVRGVARLSNRCIRGSVHLSQGFWYDPRVIDGKLVDVGGCINTLIASQPSRGDHGNAQQAALVKITKVNY